MTTSGQKRIECVTQALHSHLRDLIRDQRMRDRMARLIGLMGVDHDVGIEDELKGDR